MKNRKLVYVFAFSLSLIFSLLYLGLFQLYTPSTKNKPMNLYLNQVGLYKEEDNALKIKEDLNQKEIEGYIYKKDDVYAVVCGVSDDKQTNLDNGEKLKQLSYSYLMKEIKIQDDRISKQWEEGNVVQVLEMIAHQSK